MKPITMILATAVVLAVVIAEVHSSKSVCGKY